METRLPTKRRIKNTGIIKHDVYNAESRAARILLPASLRDPQASKTGVREELGTTKNVRAFLVKDILSRKECEDVIAQLDEAGWQEKDDIKSEYPVNYRNNQRLIILDKDFAQNLFLRLVPHFQERELVAIKPMGFGADGIWKPVGLNDCFLFTRYGTGQFFKPHFDGHYKNMQNQISIYSVTLYLNEVQEGDGGNLIFYSGTRVNPVEVCRWRPLQGCAVIFQHDVLHEGEEIFTPGTYKYIARTSVMFERVTNLSASLCIDPNFLKMREIFAHFDYFRAAEDPELFTRKFLEAQELQMLGGRTHWTMENQDFFMEEDVFHNVVSSYLDIATICRLAEACKAWLITCRKGNLWFTLYERNFGAVGAAIVNPLKLPNECIDWYGAFAARATISQKISPTILHTTNLSWHWWREKRGKGKDRCRVDFEYDGWDAEIRNWFFDTEYNTDIEFWWGGNWPTQCEPGEEKNHWISDGQLRSKLITEDPTFRNDAFNQVYDSYGQFSRGVLVEVLWPHWWCHPNSKAATYEGSKDDGTPNQDWTLITEYSRGLEFLEEIMPSLNSRLGTAAVSILEAGLAGLSAANLSTGTVICVSLHGVVVVYNYLEFKPNDNPVVFPVKNWNSLTDDEEVINFVVSCRPDVIMCDIGDTLSEKAQHNSNYRPVRLFFRFVVDHVVPCWKEKIMARGRGVVPVFITQQMMMEGACTFAHSEHLTKSLVYVSDRLGGLLGASKFITSISEQEGNGPICPEYALKNYCPGVWRQTCTKRHVQGCRDWIATRCCPRDRSVCPYAHPDKTG